MNAAVEAAMEAAEAFIQIVIGVAVEAILVIVDAEWAKAIVNFLNYEIL
jgi:hypothetical protein